MEENILFKLKNTTYNDFAKSLIYYLIIFNCFIEVLLMLFVYSDAFTPDEHNRYVMYLTLSTICLILLLFAYHKDKIKNTNLENVHYENKEKIKKIQSRIYELNKKLEQIVV